MAGYNRHLKGKTNPQIVDVRGSSAVEAGDLMYRNTVDNYAHPFNELVTSTAGTARENTLYTNFLGVAMETSPSGVTEKITIATSGVFRFPLNIASAVTIGALVSACSVPGDSGSSAAVVTNNATASAFGTTCYLGYIVKTESACTYVDFELRTAFGPGGSAS